MEVTEDDIMGAVEGFTRVIGENPLAELFLNAVELVMRDTWNVFPQITLPQLIARPLRIQEKLLKLIAVLNEYRGVNRWPTDTESVTTMDAAWLNGVPSIVAEAVKIDRLWKDKGIMEEAFMGILREMEITPPWERLKILLVMALNGSVAAVAKRHPLMGRKELAETIRREPETIVANFEMTPLGDKWLQTIQKAVSDEVEIHLSSDDEELTDEDIKYGAPRIEGSAVRAMEEEEGRGEVGGEGEEINVTEEMGGVSPVLDFDDIPLLPPRRKRVIPKKTKSRAPRKKKVVESGTRKLPKMSYSHLLVSTGDGEWARICREQAEKWTRIFREELTAGELPAEAGFKEGDTITPEQWNKGGDNPYQKQRFKRFSQYQMFTRRMRKRRDEDLARRVSPSRKPGVVQEEADIDLTVDNTTIPATSQAATALLAELVSPVRNGRDEARRVMVARAIEKKRAMEEVAARDREEEKSQRDARQREVISDIAAVSQKGMAGILASGPVAATAKVRARIERRNEGVEVETEVVHSTPTAEFVLREREREREREERGERDDQIELKRIEAERERERNNAEVEKARIAADLQRAEMENAKRESEHKAQAEARELEMNALRFQREQEVIESKRREDARLARRELSEEEKAAKIIFDKKSEAEAVAYKTILDAVIERRKIEWMKKREKHTTEVNERKQKKPKRKEGGTSALQALADDEEDVEENEVPIRPLSPLPNLRDVMKATRESIFEGPTSARTIESDRLVRVFEEKREREWENGVRDRENALLNARLAKAQAEYDQKAKITKEKKEREGEEKKRLELERIQIMNRERRKRDRQAQDK
jgi:hypothetical protein